MSTFLPLMSDFSNSVDPENMQQNVSELLAHKIPHLKTLKASLTFCIRETHKRVLLQTVKTQMKMQHDAAFHLVKVKEIFRQKNTIFFENYILTPL